MRIKLDENLPESLVGPLAALGHAVDTVRQEGLVGYPDPELWQAAQRTSRLLITQDMDFSDIRKFRPGMHHGLLLLRLRLPGRLALARRLLDVFQTLDVESWARCFVLVTDRKIRVHRPKS
jgi:predicted nuclease of predicted toxin-antitoxin system